MTNKFLAVITLFDGSVDEIVGFEDWKGARGFLEQAGRDYGDIENDDAIEDGFVCDPTYKYSIWEYDPDKEGGGRYYQTQSF